MLTLVRRIKQYNDKNRLCIHSLDQLDCFLDNAHTMGHEEVGASHARLHGNTMRRERVSWLGGGPSYQLWSWPLPSHSRFYVARRAIVQKWSGCSAKWFLGPQDHLMDCPRGDVVLHPGVVLPRIRSLHRVLLCDALPPSWTYPSGGSGALVGRTLPAED
jgi:hypothetical protein